MYFFWGGVEGERLPGLDGVWVWGFVDGWVKEGAFLSFSLSTVSSSMAILLRF